MYLLYSMEKIDATRYKYTKFSTTMINWIQIYSSRNQYVIKLEVISINYIKIIVDFVYVNKFSANK